MSRQLRIVFPGAVYHVSARGYEKSFIFKDYKDKQRLMDIIFDVHRKYSFIIYAYAIMDNHYHLIMETIEPNLSFIMYHINKRYGTYYNIRHERKGYVFEKRFSAFIIQKGEAMKAQVQYVHMNPMRANMEKVLGEYKWTSHNYYLGNEKQSIADSEFVLSMFGEDTKTAIPEYEAYMAKSRRFGKSRTEIGVYGTGIIGEESFVKQIKLIANNKKLPEAINKRKEMKKIYGYGEIIRAVSGYYGISEVVLCSKKGCWNIYKKAAIYLLLNDGGLTGADIGRLFEMHQSSISKASNRLKDKMEKDKEIASEIEKIRVKYVKIREALIK